jgi:hypothetical protein
MKKNLRTKVKEVLIGAVFGMQRANEEMMGQSASSGSGDSGITQKQHAQNLGEALMQGEVTQEVEELRWRTYAVDEEAKKRDYIAKTGHAKKTNVPVIVQENIPIVGTVLEALETNMIKEDWHVKVGYKSFARYKIERFLKFVRIDKREKTITLIFNAQPDANYTSSASFMTALKKVQTIKNEYDASRNDIVSSISSISFITYKCIGMDDYVQVEASGIHYEDGKLNYRDDGARIKFTLAFDNYHEENTMQEFTAPTIEEKYKNKERRETTIDMGTVQYNKDKTEIVVKCEKCGKDVDDYTASIVHYELGRCLCMECYAKEKGIDLEKIKKDQNVIHGAERVEIKTQKQLENENRH